MYNFNNLFQIVCSGQQAFGGPRKQDEDILKTFSRRSRMTPLTDGKSKCRRGFLELSQHSVIGAGGAVVDNRDHSNLKKEKKL